jgi:glycine/D-amino acid oxidase-like deaminating enzyme/nitrite reductase/ring-hydroxylating ferredoxin subunit
MIFTNHTRRIIMDNKAPAPDIDLTKTPESYWIDSTPETTYPQLDEDITVDVAVVGGGLVGITTAWLLKKEGLRVAVLEADRICQGTTAHSTAKITSQHGLIYDTIKKQFGIELARQYADANENAVLTMAEVIKEYNIDCDFKWQPAYMYTQQDNYVQKIENEARVASELGIDAYYLNKIPLPFDIKAAVRFDGQAQFHPRKYVLEIAKMIPGDGCQIYENTRAIDIEEGTPHAVITKRGKKVTASKVVLASHFPFYDGMGLYFARMYPERSYILGVKMADKFPDGMYITAENPGRSLRSQRYKDEEMVLVAGEHHKTAHGEPNMMNHYKYLRDFAVETFNVVNFPYRWSTQDYYTVDKIPYIGHLRSDKPNIYVATGFRKWGISTSTVSAMLIRDLIVHGESPWQDVFNPQRGMTLKSVGQLIATNADVAANLVTGKLSIPPSDVKVEKGEGKIVEINGQKVGAYRDEQGTLHVVDTTCTHLGCELKWNNAEKTWDCPCHGSRFTYEGDIVEGPAHMPLHHLEEGPNKIDPNLM